MTKVIIIGAGQHGHVVLNCVSLQHDLEFAGFLLDEPQSLDKSDKILGSLSEYPKYKSDHVFFIARGDNQKRKKIFEELKAAGCKFINLIHPQACVEKGVVLGENVLVSAKAYVNIRSRIGDNTIINSGCIVEHDNEVGNHSHLAPGVVTGGGAKIGSEVFIGVNSSIRDHISIGDKVIVGMGSVIVKNIENNLTIYNKISYDEKLQS